MSIVVLGPFSDFLVSSLKRIEQDTGNYVAFWTAPPNEVSQLGSEFPRAVVMSSPQLARADFAAFCSAAKLENPSYDPLSPDFMEQYAYEREFVLNNLLHRADPGCAFTHEEMRDTLNNYFLIAFNLIEKYKPKIVYFGTPPHAMYDLAVYLMAKRAGVRTLLLKGTFVPEVSYVGYSVDTSLADAAVYPKAVYGFEKKKQAITNALDSRESPFYMHQSGEYYRSLAGLVRSCMRAIYGYFRRCVASYGKGEEIGYQKKKHKLMHEQTGHFGLITNAVSGVALELYYKRLASRDRSRIDQMKQYVFVPLSRQHEQTTMPSAGLMYDQKCYIKLLASCLPDHIGIIVKENSKQFLINTGIRHRSRRFYRDLQRIGVAFADLEDDSQSLIAHALCTCVTTGTAGFESVFRHQRPTIAFSSNWYADMPGVYVVRSKKDVEMFVKRLVSGEISMTSESWEKYRALMQDKMIYLYFNWARVKENGWDVSCMENNLYEIFRQELECE